MSICFGYVTDGKSPFLLNSCLEAISALQLVDIEILIIGGEDPKRPTVRHIPFDEESKPGWITRKKNLIAQNSSKDVLIILHDYISVTRDWTQDKVTALDNFEWDVLVSPIFNQDGSRYRDWVLWPFSHRLLRIPFKYSLGNLLPYDVSNLTDFMYVNGSAMIVKRDYLLKNPFDENRSWGQGEDVEWSIRLRTSWKLVFHRHIPLQCLKKKDTAFRKTDAISLLFLHCYALLFRIVPSSIKAKLEIPYT